MKCSKLHLKKCMRKKELKLKKELNRKLLMQLLVMIWIAALANIFFGLFPQAPLALAELSAAALLGGGA